MNSLNQLSVQTVTVYDRLAITKQDNCWQWRCADDGLNNMNIYIVDGQSFRMVVYSHLLPSHEVVDEGRTIMGGTDEGNKVVADEERTYLLSMV